MDYLIAYLLKFHREKLMDAVMTDYFGSIPSKVSDQAITVLAEKRSSIDRWLAFQSFVLQRRMLNDPKNAATIYGMCIQLKLMSHMISVGGKNIPDEAEDTKPASEAARLRKEEEEKEFQAAIKGADNFIKGVGKS